jgi:thiamine phosphate synthase YjbQ (UPF0047 family)
VTVHTSTIELSTQGDAQIIDVTARVMDIVTDSGLSSGIGCVFVPGATGAVTTIEYEPGCIADLQRLLDRLAPPGRDYAHEQRWHDGNGHLARVRELGAHVGGANPAQSRRRREVETASAVNRQSRIKLHGP